MTLASDVLPRTKVTEGISRFAFTISPSEWPWVPMWDSRYRKT